MPRWTIQVDEKTDRMIRIHLARTGGTEDDLSRFVTEAARRAAFWETVDAVHERNKDVDPAEIEAAIDEAVMASRSGKGDAPRP